MEKVLASREVYVYSVRAVFNEGDRIFPNSAIFDRAHIQILIRDLSLIQKSCLIEEDTID